MKKIKRYAIGLFFGALSYVVFYIFAGYALRETIEITPTKTERVDGQYLIFSDKGVFSNHDDFRFFKFDSSDVYAKLSSSINHKVRVTVTGVRFPILSLYKNIIDVNE